MATVRFTSDVQSISGKLCSKDGIIYSVNKRTGKTYRSDRHGHTDANTAEQQTVRQAFTAGSKLASAWWKANKPSTANAAGTANYQLVMKAYKSQTKIGNPYSYLRTLVTPEMKVKLGDLDITDGASASGSATGGGTSGGSGTVEG